MDSLPAAGVLLGVGTCISALNWACLFASWRTGRFRSSVPLAGGLCLAVGAALLPTLRPYAWLVGLLDWGTVVFLVAVPALAREWWATCRWNLLDEFVGRRGRTTVNLSLFRRNLFVLRWSVERPRGECGMLGMGKGGTWSRDADALVLQDGAARAVFDRLPTVGGTCWRCSAGFAATEGNPELSLEGMELRHPRTGDS